MSNSNLTPFLRNCFIPDVLPRCLAHRLKIDSTEVGGTNGAGKPTENPREAKQMETLQYKASLLPTRPVKGLIFVRRFASIQVSSRSESFR